MPRPLPRPSLPWPCTAPGCQSKPACRHRPIELPQYSGQDQQLQVGVQRLQAEQGLFVMRVRACVHRQQVLSLLQLVTRLAASALDSALALDPGCSSGHCDHALMSSALNCIEQKGTPGACQHAWQPSGEQLRGRGARSQTHHLVAARLRSLAQAVRAAWALGAYEAPALVGAWRDPAYPREVRRPPLGTCRGTPPHAWPQGTAQPCMPSSIPQPCKWSGQLIGLASTSLCNCGAQVLAMRFTGI